MVSREMEQKRSKPGAVSVCRFHGPACALILVECGATASASASAAAASTTAAAACAISPFAQFCLQKVLNALALSLSLSHALLTMQSGVRAQRKFAPRCRLRARGAGCQAFVSTRFHLCAGAHTHAHTCALLSSVSFPLFLWFAFLAAPYGCLVSSCSEQRVMPFRFLHHDA